MEKEKSWDIITSIGNQIRRGWKKVAKENSVNISILGIPALSTFTFDSKKSLEYKTLLTQEMLKKGYLASTNFYASTAHSEDVLNLYFEALNEVYKTISECEIGNILVEDLLESPICHSGFKRLN